MLLPKIPSRLIRIALEDMKTTIDQGILIDMSMWGNGDLTKKERCSVCFAGSVMLQRTKVGVNPNMFNILYDDENYSQYQFLDSIRQGKLNDAMEYLQISYDPVNDPNFVITQWIEEIPNWVTFGNDENKFIVKVAQLADLLESQGL